MATFYSKSCFWWLTPLLWLGYKEPLELEDLGQMKLEDSARSHYDHFLYIYTEKKVGLPHTICTHLSLLTSWIFFLFRKSQIHPHPCGIAI